MENPYGLPVNHSIVPDEIQQGQGQQGQATPTYRDAGVAMPLHTPSQQSYQQLFQANPLNPRTPTNPIDTLFARPSSNNDEVNAAKEYGRATVKGAVAGTGRLMSYYGDEGEQNPETQQKLREYARQAAIRKQQAGNNPNLSAMEKLGMGTAANPYTYASAPLGGLPGAAGRIVAGTAIGGILGATEPDSNPKSTAISAAVGGGLSALGEIVPHIPEIYKGSRNLAHDLGDTLSNTPIAETLAKLKDSTHNLPGITDKIRDWVTHGTTLHPDINNPSIIHNPNVSVSDISDMSFADLLRASRSQSDTGAEAAKELQLVKRKIATQNNIDLSLGDLTGDTRLQEAEKGLEGRVNSGGKSFRYKQGNDVISAATNRLNESYAASDSPALRIQYRDAARKLAASGPIQQRIQDFTGFVDSLSPSTPNKNLIELNNLIKELPRAGATPPPSTDTLAQVATKFILKKTPGAFAGEMVGGPVGAAVGAATVDPAFSAAINKIHGNMLFHPNLEALAEKPGVSAARSVGAAAFRPGEQQNIQEMPINEGMGTASGYVRGQQPASGTAKTSYNPSGAPITNPNEVYGQAQRQAAETTLNRRAAYQATNETGTLPPLGSVEQTRAANAFSNLNTKRFAGTMLDNEIERSVFHRGIDPGYEKVPGVKDYVPEEIINADHPWDTPRKLGGEPGMVDREPTPEEIRATVIPKMENHLHYLENNDVYPDIKEQNAKIADIKKLMQKTADYAAAKENGSTLSFEDFQEGLQKQADYHTALAKQNATRLNPMTGGGQGTGLGRSNIQNFNVPVEAGHMQPPNVGGRQVSTIPTNDFPQNIPNTQTGSYAQGPRSLGAAGNNPLVPGKSSGLHNPFENAENEMRAVNADLDKLKTSGRIVNPKATTPEQELTDGQTLSNHVSTMERLRNQISEQALQQGAVGRTNIQSTLKKLDDTIVQKAATAENPSLFNTLSMKVKGLLAKFNLIDKPETLAAQPPKTLYTDSKGIIGQTPEAVKPKAPGGIDASILVDLDKVPAVSTQAELDKIPIGTPFRVKGHTITNLKEPFHELPRYRQSKDIPLTAADLAGEPDLIDNFQEINSQEEFDKLKIGTIYRVKGTNRVGVKESKSKYVQDQMNKKLMKEE